MLQRFIRYSDMILEKRNKLKNLKFMDNSDLYNNPKKVLYE